MPKAAIKQRKGNGTRELDLGIAEVDAKAQVALSAVVAAEEKADGAITAAGEAQNVADQAQTGAEAAQATASQATEDEASALKIANSSIFVANQAQLRSAEAMSTANTAGNNANRANEAAKAAQATADQVQATADGKVSKAGDTVTGPLTLEQSLRFNSNEIDVAVKPARNLFKEIDFWDKANFYMGAFRSYQNTAGDIAIDLYAANKKADGTLINNILGLYISKDKSYGVCPDPRENIYANDIDTLRASINRHPIKLTANKNFYVGGANASDTANLFQGRGESAAMPFATLAAAVNWVSNHYVGNYDVSIILHADMSMPAIDFYMNNIASLRLMGDSAQRTITCGS